MAMGDRRAHFNHGIRIKGDNPFDQSRSPWPHPHQKMVKLANSGIHQRMRNGRASPARTHEKRFFTGDFVICFAEAGHEPETVEHVARPASVRQFFETG